jgi:hypothetical protein
MSAHRTVAWSLWFPGQQISRAQLIFNGGDDVKVYWERVRASDAETRIRIRPPHTDQWHENKIQLDNDWKNTEREIWHNIAHDDAEKCNFEWSESQDRKMKNGMSGAARVTVLENTSASESRVWGDPRPEWKWVQVRISIPKEHSPHSRTEFDDGKNGENRIRSKQNRQMIQLNQTRRLTWN